MKEKAAAAAGSDKGDARHLLLILRQAMRDPALSGGCPLLGELFAAIAQEEEAEPLLDATPVWKMPGLLLSAAILFRALATARHPLARYLPGSADPDDPSDASFRGAVRRAIVEDRAALAALMLRHTYQCNPPRRMAVSLIAIAAATEGWDSWPAMHVDLGTASGIGLLLGQVRAVSDTASVGPADSQLDLPIALRGTVLDLGVLKCPRIETSVGIDLDPPNLHDAECRAWMRACQFPVAAEWTYFDRAVDLVLAQNPRIERGSATDILPRLASHMPVGQPMVVTDTYTTVFMTEEDRERLRRELDEIARSRPVVWVSNNPLIPPGNAPDRTTAGTAIPQELVERNRQELFGALCATTWPNGKRTARLLGINHPGACWLEWHPDMSRGP